MDSKTARIRALNDALRQTLTGGHAVITPGVASIRPSRSRHSATSLICDGGAKSPKEL